MSELLSDMANGKCCMFCGDYFSKPGAEANEIFTHGEQVVCERCWRGLTPSEKDYHTRAKVETIEAKIIAEGAKCDNCQKDTSAHDLKPTFSTRVYRIVSTCDPCYNESLTTGI